MIGKEVQIKDQRTNGRSKKFSINGFCDILVATVTEPNSKIKKIEPIAALSLGENINSIKERCEILIQMEKLAGKTISNFRIGTIKNERARQWNLIGKPEEIFIGQRRTAKS